MNIIYEFPQSRKVINNDLFLMKTHQVYMNLSPSHFLSPYPHFINVMRTQNMCFFISKWLHYLLQIFKSYWNFMKLRETNFYLYSNVTKKYSLFFRILLTKLLRCLYHNCIRSCVAYNQLIILFVVRLTIHLSKLVILGGPGNLSWAMGIALITCNQLCARYSDRVCKWFSLS